MPHPQSKYRRHLQMEGLFHIVFSVRAVEKKAVDLDDSMILYIYIYIHIYINTYGSNLSDLNLNLPSGPCEQFSIQHHMLRSCQLQYRE